MGWGKAKHNSAIAAGEGCTALLCGFRTLGVAHPCLQEASRVCVTGGDAAPWGLSAAAACTSYQCRGRETSCSPCLMLMWANQPGEASAWSQRHPATNWSSMLFASLRQSCWVVTLPLQWAGNMCFLPAIVLGKLSPQQLCCGSQTSVLQAVLATPLGCN